MEFIPIYIEAGIFDGDLLIVDRSLTAQNGHIIVANYNGYLVCKIIDKDQARLLSPSKDHAPVKRRLKSIKSINCAIKC